MKKIILLLIERIDSRFSTQLLRKNFAKRYLKKRTSAVGGIPQISSDNQKRIDDYWKKGLGVKVTSQYFALYNKVNNENGFDVRYIPDDLFFVYLDPYYNNISAAKWLDDKGLYDLLFADIKRPVTIARKMGGILLGEDYCRTDIDTIIEQCKTLSLREVIIKKAIDSEGGKGVQIINTFEDAVTLRSALHASKDFVVQGVLRQHSAISAIHQESINTIRVMTLIHEEEVHILSCILRMGRGGKRVDNASSGGLFCGIDDDGCLREHAYDYDGFRFDSHPSSGVVFDGYYIPGIDEIKKIVKQKALRLSRFCKMVSWDFAIGEDGDPVFIEVNMSYGEVNFHQMTNGPLLKDLTPSVIKEVFSDSLKRRLNRLL